MCGEHPPRGTTRDPANPLAHFDALKKPSSAAVAAAGRHVCDKAKGNGAHRAKPAPPGAMGVKSQAKGPGSGGVAVHMSAKDGGPAADGDTGVPPRRSKAQRILLTFALLLVPVLVFLAAAIVLSKYLGAEEVCSETCRCSWGELWRHILLRRLPFDVPLHVYAAHTFVAALPRPAGAPLRARYVIIPTIIATALECVVLWAMHTYLGLSSYGELMVALGITFLVVVSAGLAHQAVKRAVLATAVPIYAALVLSAVHALQRYVVSAGAVDWLTTMWPAIVFVFGELFVVTIDELLERVEADGGAVPERQLLHIAIAQDCFNDAARALLVVTIDNLAVLLINLLLTVIVEVISRNNLHKWLLSAAMRGCCRWEPKPTRLESLIRASQLYAGYMPFPAFIVMFVVGYFPWATGFVACADGSLSESMTVNPWLVPLLFATEGLSTGLALLVHAKGRCLLPSDSAAGDLVPMFALRGLRQCTILATALGSFVLYGFAASGDLAQLRQGGRIGRNATDGVLTSWMGAGARG